MSEFVGVKFWLPGDVSSLKREALMFSRIIIPNHNSFLNIMRWRVDRYPEHLVADLEWLAEQGIVYEPDNTRPDVRLIDDEEFRRLYASESHLDEEMARFEQEMNGGAIPDDEVWIRTLAFMHLGTLRFDNLVRRLSVELRQLHEMDACPLLSNQSGLLESPDNKTQVVRIVINSLPLPDESTPWEQILEFRADPDSQRKFSRLRDWMNDVARDGLQANEIHDKLESLQNDYEHHMKIHRMKTVKSSLAVMLTSAGGLMTPGGLLTKIPSIIGSLYSIKIIKVSLMEGETNAPGREIAYVMKADQAFGDGLRMS